MRVPILGWLTIRVFDNGRHGSLLTPPVLWVRLKAFRKGRKDAIFSGIAKAEPLVRRRARTTSVPPGTSNSISMSLSAFLAIPTSFPDMPRSTAAWLTRSPPHPEE
jgi:hypothetical protein